jgi:hypothetical protein
MAVIDQNGEFFLDCTNGVEAITVLIEPRNLAKRRMWLDTRKPLASVSVSMNTEDRSSEVFMRGFDVETDAEGRFKLPNIPPNNRFVLYTKIKEMQELGVALAPQKISTGADGSTVDLGDLTGSIQFKSECLTQSPPRTQSKNRRGHFINRNAVNRLAACFPCVSFQFLCVRGGLCVRFLLHRFGLKFGPAYTLQGKIVVADG